MMTRKLLKWINNVAFAGALSLLSLGAVAYVYSWVEGYIDPVMTRLEISNVRQGPTEFSITFDGTATKLRDCTWIETNWYIGERGDRSVRTDGDYSGRPRINGAGLLTWADQTVEMSPQELFQNSHANVVHQCPWGLWRTITPFYDSNDDVPMPELGPPVTYDLQEQIDQLTRELQELK
jgi:hypothetical protein